jgi:hypothetical protein
MLADWIVICNWLLCMQCKDTMISEPMCLWLQRRIDGQEWEYRGELVERHGRTDTHTPSYPKLALILHGQPCSQGNIGTRLRFNE